MAKTTIADRISQIIRERGITKADFARAMGITRNYIYTLTGSKQKIKTISPTLAKLIEKEYGYPAEWVLTGEIPAGNLSREIAGKVAHLSEEELRSVVAYLDALKKGSGESE